MGLKQQAVTDPTWKYSPHTDQAIASAEHLADTNK